EFQMQSGSVFGPSGFSYIFPVGWGLMLLATIGIAMWNRVLMRKFVERYMLVHGVDLKEDMSKLPFLERIGLWLPRRDRSKIEMMPGRLQSALSEESSDQELEAARRQLTTVNPQLIRLATFVVGGICIALAVFGPQ
ncbi:MAG: hypothetical protein M1319_00655, partial [Chloroflexi bacterium]|nr:hypothetical protein [Chloroflexota bacterium]